MILLAGCGRVGAPMLAALRDAGFAARGFDVVAKTQPYITQDRDDVFHKLRRLITVVRDIAQTDDVLFGAQNLIATARHLSTVIISSTLSPRYVRALRERIPAHITLIDAPMSGAAVAAEEARLSFMLGGEPQDIATHPHPQSPAICQTRGTGGVQCDGGNRAGQIIPQLGQVKGRQQQRRRHVIRRYDVQQITLGQIPGRDIA